MPTAAHGPRNHDNVLSQSLADVTALLSEVAPGAIKSTKRPVSKLSQHLLLAIQRHRASMDWLIDELSQGRVRPRTRRVLWWAMAQILWSDGVAAPIVTDVATAYVKKRHAAAEAGFVNAFLRRLCARLAELGRDGLTDGAPPWVKLELPETLWQRWRRQFTPEELSAMADLLQQPADTVFRRRRWPENTLPKGVAALLQPLPAPPWALDQELFVLKKRCDGVSLSQIMGRSSVFYIQDPSTLLAPTLLAPALLAPLPGEQVADLCCAPGGKALLLAEALRGRGRLHCFDRVEAKLSRVRENLAGFANVSIAVGNATKPQLPSASLDALMLDVPCSNSGVIRRRPDVRWAFSEASLRELTALQAQILRAGAALLKPGGRLVYSTCSIENEENQAQVRAFLDSHPDFILSTEQLLLPTTTHDGAYAALLRRV